MLQEGGESAASDRDRRLYTLAEDPEHHFLMEYYVGDSFMNQPYFFRAIDTAGKDMEIPAYIETLGYEFWQTE